MNRRDEITILMKASDIPNKNIVTKRTGTYPFTLVHDLKVYSDTKGESPIEIKGTFLLNERGDINQISSDTVLAMKMTAGALHEWLDRNIEDLDPDWDK